MKAVKFLSPVELFLLSVVHSKTARPAFGLWCVIESGVVWMHTDLEKENAC